MQLAHEQAAVLVNNLTADKASHRRDQKLHRMGKLLRLTKTTDGDIIQQHLDHFFRISLDTRGANIRRRNTVDRDTIFGALAG